ncbi:MAG: hypothetical protein AB1342_14165 [Pseudomonadota bacterium]
MKNRILFAACTSTLAMASASAQSPAVQPLAARVASEFSSQQARQEGMVRVSSNISYFVPGPTDDSEAGQKLRDRARRQIYETASRECGVLLETLAATCRMENVSSNLNVTSRQYNNPNQIEGFTINGSMSYQITLK